MKTIKIIDLLNKIAKYEEVPKYVQYYNIMKEETETMLVCKENIVHKLEQLEIKLNSRVEIIEEIIEEKKIPEKINVKGSYNSNKGYEDFNDNEKILVDKINEILDYIESKEKGE